MRVYVRMRLRVCVRARVYMWLEGLVYKSIYVFHLHFVLSPLCISARVHARARVTFIPSICVCVCTCLFTACSTYVHKRTSIRCTVLVRTGACLCVCVSIYHNRCSDNLFLKRSITPVSGTNDLRHWYMATQTDGQRYRTTSNNDQLLVVLGPSNHRHSIINEAHIPQIYNGVLN